MRNVARRSCRPLFAVLLLAFAFTAQAQVPQADHASARTFVEGFYRWYVPQALGNSTTAAWVLALARRPSAFGPGLARLLRAESAAQARCAELVGIDFDPFLDTQDPANVYVVGEISSQGHHYWAPIFAVQNGKRSDNPDVRAELSEDNGRWLFVNFHYPDGTNLLNILGSPRPKCSVPRDSGRSD